VAVFARCFLASVGLLRALWQRYFRRFPPGFTARPPSRSAWPRSAPILLQRGEVYEVAIKLRLCADDARPRRHLARAAPPGRTGRMDRGGERGLRIGGGARPPVLFSTVILILPVAARGRRATPAVNTRLAAAGGGPAPALCGLGLAAYNGLAVRAAPSNSARLIRSWHAAEHRTAFQASVISGSTSASFISFLFFAR